MGRSSTISSRRRCCFVLVVHHGRLGCRRRCSCSSGGIFLGGGRCCGTAAVPERAPRDELAECSLSLAKVFVLVSPLVRTVVQPREPIEIELALELHSENEKTQRVMSDERTVMERIRIVSCNHTHYFVSFLLFLSHSTEHTIRKHSRSCIWFV